MVDAYRSQDFAIKLSIKLTILLTFDALLEILLTLGASCFTYVICSCPALIMDLQAGIILALNRMHGCIQGRTKRRLGHVDYLADLNWVQTPLSK